MRGGTPARPGPARPAGRRMGVEAPEGGLGAWLSLRREPKLRKLPGIGAFLEEKQTGTSALVPGARASSFRRPGLAVPFPVFCTQTLCFQSLLGAPRPSTHTHKVPASAPSASFVSPCARSFPYPSPLPSPSNLTVSGQSSLKIVCPHPSFLCPVYHITA